MRSTMSHPLPRKPASLPEARATRAASAASCLASAADPAWAGRDTPVAAAKLTSRPSVSPSSPSMPASLHADGDRDLIRDCGHIPQSAWGSKPAD